MEQVYNEKIDCCGCTACYNGCPMGAIEMGADSEGFSYPIINQELCIDCNWCRRICPFINSDELKEGEVLSYQYAKNKNVDTLMKSTSGGAFSAISDVILEDGGVVYGATFDENFKVVHSKATTVDERDAMRKSKYSQSDLGEVFKEIQDLLTRNIKVLFVGTPCQVAGLKGFLSNLKWDENFYTVDLICHSIPSPKVFADYLKLIEKEEKGKITWVDFRYKDRPWTRENSNQGFKYKIAGSDEIRTKDLFYKMFFKWKTIMRPSCSICPFTDTKRVGDLTIADYWGIESYEESLYDDKGVSCIIVNSEKGKNLLPKLGDKLVLVERDFKEALEHQGRLREPTEFPDTREVFWRDYGEIGLEGIIESGKEY